MDHLGRGERLSSRGDLIQRVTELLPSLGWFLSNPALTQPGLEIATLTFRRRTELIPKFLGGPDGDAGEKASQTLEGDLVRRD